MESPMAVIKATCLDMSIEHSPHLSKFRLVTHLVDHIQVAITDDASAGRALVSETMAAVDRARHSYEEELIRDESGTPLPLPIPKHAQNHPAQPGHLAALMPTFNPNPASSSLYRRMFKVTGTIGGPNSLDYISICSQVNDARQTGYEEGEIVIGLKKAIAAGTTLRTYFDSKSNLSLDSILSFLRDFFKQKSATELFSNLSTISQDPHDSATTFLLKSFELRERVFAATKAENHQFDTRLIYSTFSRAVITGLRSDSIRNHMSKFLGQTELTHPDEALLREINVADSMKVETEAKHRKPKAAVQAVSFQEEAMTKLMEPLMENLASLTRQMNDLQTAQASRPPLSRPRNYAPRPYRKCGACEANGSDRCHHCFNCGSSSHMISECNVSRHSGNGR